MKRLSQAREDNVAKLLVDNDKYAEPNASVVVDAYHAAIHDLIRRKLDDVGGDWASFVFDKSYDLDHRQGIRRDREEAARDRPPLRLVGDDLGARAARGLQARGRRRRGSAGLLVSNIPKRSSRAADADGREQRGIGDNVVKYAKNLIGIARYIRSSDRVLELLTNGVPADTVAIIDDSGGTLTAPILEQFKGVICAGGTVRSHLGILTREYGIPCVMNAKISGIKEGDRVEIECTARRQDRRGLPDRRRNDRQGLAAHQISDSRPRIREDRPMGSSRITYAQLLETNNLIQASADETYWLCVTRTVQESKLFPVPAYMMLSYMMAYFRYPSLLRKIERACRPRRSATARATPASRSRTRRWVGRCRASICSAANG